MKASPTESAGTAGTGAPRSTSMPPRMTGMVQASLRAVQAWVEQRDYRGYDPGDGLTSFLRPLTRGTLLGERLLQQLVWKFPFNLRPLVGVVPLESTKGRGFMAGGYARLAAAGDESAAEKARACLAWLVTHREAGHAGPCWGNHFDFSTRGGRIPAHTPTIVWTSLIGHAFLEAHAVLGDDRHLDVAAGACRWILTLPRERTDDGACLSYTALNVNPVHNANLLGAGLLARTGRSGRSRRSARRPAPRSPTVAGARDPTAPGGTGRRPTTGGSTVSTRLTTSTPSSATSTRRATRSSGPTLRAVTTITGAFSSRPTAGPATTTTGHTRWTSSAPRRR